LVYQHKQQAAIEDVLAWLEDELRAAKAQIVRIEQSVDRGDGQIGELNLKLHTSDDRTAALAAQIGDIPQFSGRIAHLAQSVTRTEESNAAADRRLSEGARVQQVESERLRQELNGALRRVESLERLVEAWGARFENVETTINRIQESLTLAHQRTEELDRRQESSEQRATRVAEALNRSEHDVGRLEVEIEAIRRDGDLSMERLRAFAEALKRQEEQSDAVAAEVTAQRDIFERIDLLRAELHRVEDRLAAGETRHDEDRGQIEDAQRLIGLLDGKNHGFADRLAMLQGELAAYRDQVADQFHRLHQALDRQKRRQIEELDRELRDLKVHTFRPPEEGPND
jgi:chromosome segregation ATPase